MVSQLLILLWALAASIVQTQHVASSEWSHEYQTQSTRDVAISVALDEAGGFAFIVGRTKGPRGMNVSFVGLTTHNQAGDRFDDSRTYHDAVIAKVALRSKKVEWAKRISNIHDTAFSAVALSKDKKTVVAAGAIREDKDAHPFIFQAFDAVTGEEIGSLVKSPTEGRHFVRSIAITKEALFVCGKTSRENGDSIDSSKAQVGGIMVAKVSMFGDLFWLKQGGTELDTDYCSGLSLSQLDDTLYIAGTSHRKSESGVVLGVANVYALSTNDGSIQWMQQLQNSVRSELRSSDVLVDKDAVYISTSFWSEQSAGRKIVMHKLSRPRGTLLWSEETCCMSIQNGDLNVGEYDGKGGGEPVCGLSMGSDRYVYHLGYYQRKQELVDDKHATVVVRIGEYGEQSPAKDISSPVETFKIIPSEPKRAAFSSFSQSVYILSNNMFISAEDADMSVPKLDMVKFQVHHSKAISKPAEGKVFLKVIFRAQITSVSAGAVFDILAEKLRISHSQMNLITSQTPNSLSQPTEVRFMITVFGTMSDVLFNDLKNELDDLFHSTGQSGRNVIERHFRLTQGSVHLIADSIQRTDEGGTTGGGNLTGSRDKPSEEGPNISWKSFAIAVGGFAGLVAVIAGISIFLRGRRNMEESFAEPVLDGRPVTGDTASLSYFEAY